MAKKQKHGRVERRKPRQILHFRLGGVFFLVLLAFIICFSLHMREALTTENYWQDQIAVNSVEEETETVSSAQVINPVPESERMDESRLSLCAWVGDEPALKAYFKTASDMYISGAVSGMSEADMKTAARSLKESRPEAVYLWLAPSESLPDLSAFTRIFQFEMPGIPLYILSSLPVSDADKNREIDQWNSNLFAAADACGIHFVDVSTALKSNEDALAPEYADDDSRYNAVTELILTHIDD